MGGVEFFVLWCCRFFVCWDCKGVDAFYLITCASKALNHKALVDDDTEQKSNYRHEEHAHAQPGILFLVNFLEALWGRSVHKSDVLVCSSCQVRAGFIFRSRIKAIYYLRNSKILATCIYKCPQSLQKCV